jgi:hypothetical protein
MVISGDRSKGKKKLIDFELLSKVRKASREMSTPSWMTRLHGEFGSAAAGSLKADEWRVVATLYMPLVMVMEWSKGRNETSDQLSEERKQQLNLLQLTMHLTSAVLACTSHTVTEESANLYKHHMLEYLKGVQKLFPDQPWYPNYHAALHLAEFLTALGPTHGWWTFPFERLIKVLQSANTNSRMGELEKTMADTFHLACRLRRAAFSNAFGVESEQLAAAIRGMASKLDNITTATIKGTLFSDVYRDVDQFGQDDEVDVPNGLLSNNSSTFRAKVIWQISRCHESNMKALRSERPATHLGIALFTSRKAPSSRTTDSHTL